MRLHVIEPQMIGYKHMLFNSAIIKHIASSERFERIIFYAEENHSSIIKNSLNNDNLEKISYKSLRGKFHTLAQIVINFYKRDDLICLSLHPIQLLLIFLLTTISRKKVFVILHGELGILKKKNPQIKGKIFRRFLKIVLRYRRRNFQLILVSRPVLENLDSLNYNVKNVILIDHPILLNNYNNTTPIPNDEIRFGTIGTALLIKNSQLISEIQSRLGSRVKIYHIGTIDKSLRQYFLKENCPFYSSIFIDSEEYINEVQKLDFILSFISDGGYYDLCPSGTIVEAIRLGIPLITLNNASIRYYNKKFGPIGLCFEDHLQMSKFLADLTYSQSLEIQKSLIQNIKKAREYLSSEHSIGCLIDSFANNEI